MAQVADANEFVGGKKVFDAVGEVFGDIARVIGECFGSVARLPAACEGLRQIPVEERNERGDAIFEQFVDDAIIVVDTLRVGLAFARRKNA